MESKNKNFVYKTLVSPPPRSGLPDNVRMTGVPFGGHKFKNRTAENGYENYITGPERKRSGEKKQQY